MRTGKLFLLMIGPPGTASGSGKKVADAGFDSLPVINDISPTIIFIRIEAFAK